MTWVKICGTTSIEDARLAVEAGADALGFVFAESPRRVTPKQARDMIRELPQQIEKIGVFVRKSSNQIAEIVEAAGLTGVQLHGERSARRVAALRAQIDRSERTIRLLCAWRLDEFPPSGSYGIAMPAGEDKPDALLLDSRSSIARGGTGTSFDWTSWGVFLRTLRRTLPPLVVAGGLNPDNAAEAIRLLRPWGVDVVSGVECEPGKKDPKKVRAFITAVRQADKEHASL